MFKVTDIKPPVSCKNCSKVFKKNEWRYGLNDGIYCDDCKDVAYLRQQLEKEMQRFRVFDAGYKTHYIND